jgi:prepilin-type N-terminal cleavage/methylation domain-containing protein
MPHKIKKSKAKGAGNGFTLVEVLFSLVIIAAITVSVFSLVQRTIGFLPGAGKKLVACYLAQEGMEIVRNLRDNNRFAQPTVPWNYGLTGCATGCEIDFSGQTLSSWANRYLKNDNGLYDYVAGEATNFRRKITITASGDDILIVNVQVFWDDKGVAGTLSAVEKLYNW